MDEPTFRKNSRKSDWQIWISELYLEVCYAYKSYHNTNLTKLSIAVKFFKEDCRQTKNSTILKSNPHLFQFQPRLASKIISCFISYCSNKFYKKSEGFSFKPIKIKTNTLYWKIKS